MATFPLAWNLGLTGLSPYFRSPTQARLGTRRVMGICFYKLDYEEQNGQGKTHFSTPEILQGL